jgi:hypothetical protein
MIKYCSLIATVAFLCIGCSNLSTEKCLQKEGFKSCEDLKAAASKAVGNDEVYKFHSIAKKCRCEE